MKILPWLGVRGRRAEMPAKYGQKNVDLRERARKIADHRPR